MQAAKMVCKHLYWKLDIEEEQIGHVKIWAYPLQLRKQIA